jgi:hypothetical protein
MMVDDRKLSITEKILLVLAIVIIIFSACMSTVYGLSAFSNREQYDFNSNQDYDIKLYLFKDSVYSRQTVYFSTNFSNTTLINHAFINYSKKLVLNRTVTVFNINFFNYNSEDQTIFYTLEGLDSNYTGSIHVITTGISKNITISNVSVNKRRLLRYGSDQYSPVKDRLYNTSRLYSLPY